MAPKAPSPRLLISNDPILRSAPPAARISGIAATARFARFEKSTRASTQIFAPMTAISPKRYSSMPPRTLIGMLSTRAPNLGMKPSRMAVIAATMNTQIEKTRVMHDADILGIRGLAGATKDRADDRGQTVAHERAAQVAG